MQEKPPKSRLTNWKQFQKLSFDPKKIRRHAARVESVTTRHAHRFIIKRMNNIRYIRTHVLAWFFTAGVILATVTAQFVIGSQGYAVTAPVKEGTYAEGVLGTIDTLNPLQASTSAEVAASRLMFSSLYKYDETGRLKGDLATNMSISKSGEIYTVKLREDATWHDGQKLTADDVVFTIEVIKDPESRSRSTLRTNWQDIKVEKLNEHTVKFSLPPYAAFPHALTFPVVPKHILQDVPMSAIPESAFASEPVGSGPFYFRMLLNTDIASNHRTLHMNAYEDYYEGAPKINRFELHAYPDIDTFADALNSREITAAADVPQSVVDEIENKGYVTRSYSLDNGVYLLLNTTSPILRDKQVRLALQRAVDTDKVRQATGEDLPNLDLPFIPTRFSAKLPGAPKINTVQAGKLLDQAGWKLNKDGLRKKDGKAMTLSLTTIQTEQFRKVVEEIAKQVRQLGITVEVSVIDDRAPGSNFRQDVLQQRNYDMLVYELPIGADPDVYAYWHSSQLGVSGYNFTNYSNTVSDAALASARDRIEPALREAKYATFARQWLSDAPAIGLYQQVFTYAANHNTKSLEDGTELVMSSDRYSNVIRWSVGRGQVYKTP